MGEPLIARTPLALRQTSHIRPRGVYQPVEKVAWTPRLSENQLETDRRGVHPTVLQQAAIFGGRNTSRFTPAARLLDVDFRSDSRDPRSRRIGPIDRSSPSRGARRFRRWA